MRKIKPDVGDVPAAGARLHPVLGATAQSPNLGYLGDRNDAESLQQIAFRAIECGRRIVVGGFCIGGQQVHRRKGSHGIVQGCPSIHRSEVNAHKLKIGAAAARAEIVSECLHIDSRIVGVDRHPFGHVFCQRVRKIIFKQKRRRNHDFAAQLQGALQVAGRGKEKGIAADPLGKQRGRRLALFLQQDVGNSSTVEGIGNGLAQAFILDYGFVGTEDQRKDFVGRRGDHPFTFLRGAAGLIQGNLNQISAAQLQISHLIAQRASQGDFDGIQIGTRIPVIVIGFQQQALPRLPRAHDKRTSAGDSIAGAVRHGVAHLGKLSRQVGQGGI